MRKTELPKAKKSESARRYAKDLFHLKVYLRRKVWGFLKHGQHPISTATLIGCDRKDFILHISKQFKRPMTMLNYGKVWHLDHIVPCKKFNLFDFDQRQACFHYSNIRPMLAQANRRKAGRVVVCQPELTLSLLKCSSLRSGSHTTGRLDNSAPTHHTPPRRAQKI